MRAGFAYRFSGHPSAMPVLIGTSGWQYADWKARFYPERLPQRRWFEYAMDSFATVELNVSFYRLPKREVFDGWRERSPHDVAITVKMSRFLTHIKRLREPAEPVARLMGRADALGPKLGPILVQLPPDLPVDLPALDETLRCFPAGIRVAVEPRHPSWWTPDFRSLLEQRGAALVWADRKEAPVAPLWRTADWGYLRLHEGAAPVWPFYRRAALADWADRLAGTYSDDEDAFVYFNNDPGCAAVADAVTFAEEVSRRGRTGTRVPLRPAVEFSETGTPSP